MADSCQFCDFVKSLEDIIYQDDNFVTRLDYFPVSPGHAIIVPKRHITNLLWLSTEEWSNLQTAIKETISLINTADLKEFYRQKVARPYSDISAWYCKKALGNPHLGQRPDAYNHGVNDGSAAGRYIDHLHWNIIPRFYGDVAEPIGGIRNVIPGLANYTLPR